MNTPIEVEQAPTTIFDLITQEENAYKLPIPVNNYWEWNMAEHIREGVLYKHSQIVAGKNKGQSDEKPVKNIIKPILDLQHRAEDIDLKDVVLYIEDPDRSHLDFLVKKYHDEVYVVKNDLDTYFDQLKEEKNDFGLGITMDIGQPKPDIIRLQSIAFCDQTDVLSGPIGIKYYYSPDQLKAMEKKGWGSKKYGADMTIDELLLQAESHKSKDEESNREQKTPGKYIEIYMILGCLPERYLNDKDTGEYPYQMQIVGFYKSKDMRKGVTLFKIKTENPLKVIKRDEIFGRACGWGAIEELTDDQVWTNYGEIRKKEMLDAAAKTLLMTTDATLSEKHPTGLKDLDNLELIDVQKGEDLRQVDTFPRNLQLFDKLVNDYWSHAQLMGSAHDPSLGIESNSGVPFRAQLQQVQQGLSIHEYRKGKFCKFIEEIYKDWILPYIVKELAEDQEFLATLTIDEMQMLADKISEKELTELKKITILSGQIFDPSREGEIKENIKQSFLKGGNKKYIQILKGELKNISLRVKVNVAGKQKNLGLMVERLSSIFQNIFANPQILQNPLAAKTFNMILENMGLDPIDFNIPQQMQQQMQQQMPQQTNQPAPQAMAQTQ